MRRSVDTSLRLVKEMDQLVLNGLEASRSFRQTATLWRISLVQLLLQKE